MEAVVESQSVRFRCPECRKTNKVPARYQGRKGRCGRCRATIRIPGGQPTCSNRSRTQERRPKEKAARRTRRDSRPPRTESEAACKTCGVALVEGLTQCRRCKQNARIWSGWYGLGGIFAGALFAVVGSLFAFGLAYWAGGVTVRILWLPAILGVLGMLGGAYDLSHALFAKLTGRSDPHPEAAEWLMERFQA